MRVGCRCLFDFCTARSSQNADGATCMGAMAAHSSLCSRNAHLLRAKPHRHCVPGAGQGAAVGQVGGRRCGRRCVGRLGARTVGLARTGGIGGRGVLSPRRRLPAGGCILLAGRPWGLGSCLLSSTEGSLPCGSNLGITLRLSSSYRSMHFSRMVLLSQASFGCRLPCRTAGYSRRVILPVVCMGQPGREVCMRGAVAQQGLRMVLGLATRDWACSGAAYTARSRCAGAAVTA